MARGNGFKSFRAGGVRIACGGDPGCGRGGDGSDKGLSTDGGDRRGERFDCGVGEVVTSDGEEGLGGSDNASESKALGLELRRGDGVDDTGGSGGGDGFECCRASEGRGASGDDASGRGGDSEDEGSDTGGGDCRGRDFNRGAGEGVTGDGEEGLDESDNTSETLDLEVGSGGGGDETGGGGGGSGNEMCEDTRESGNDACDNRGSDIWDLIRSRSSGAAERPVCRSGPVIIALLNMSCRVSRHIAQKSQQFSCIGAFVKARLNVGHGTHPFCVVLFHVDANNAQDMFEIQQCWLLNRVGKYNTSLQCYVCLDWCPATNSVIFICS